MTTEHVVYAALAVAALLGLAEALQHRGGRRLLGIAAAAAFCGLLYLTLYPPIALVDKKPLQVLTAGATAVVPSDADTIALPGSSAPASISRAPDLATALRRHPAVSTIQVIGYGLNAADRDAARGHGLRFDATPLPRGIAAIELPDDLRAGHAFTLRGNVVQPDGLRIALHEPGGRRREPVALDEDGRFAFTLFAPRAAEVNAELSLLDAAGAEVERITVPISVRDGVALNLLLLAGGPNADLKYLQRWALDAGHAVDARISLSRGVVQQRGEASLAEAALAATDAIIIDERAWSQLDTAARTRLLAAVDAGLGLLLRLDSPPPVALITQWHELGLPLESADSAPDFRLSGEAADAGAALQRLPLRAVGDANLVLARDDAGTALAVAHNRGLGRLGISWLYDTRTLVLSGQAALHDALWARIVDGLARPRQTPPPAAPALSWQHERMELCAHEQRLLVIAPSGEASGLSVRRGRDERWCGGFWPRESGWHTLQTESGQSRFFVRAADEARTLHLAQTAAATHALLSEARDTAPAPVPGPRWPWFLAWLVPAVLLWWLQLSRRRQAS
ncbi:MAG: hypothetical protein JNN30_21815 [Rhodanobacteraceae bacterium]|nr:hypothetical protein [Rhodanobacteraceae bacterium]